MEVVKLKNGKEEAKPLVATMMLILREMFQTDPILAYELVQFARLGPKHQFFGNAGERLVERNLVDKRADGSYSMHDSTRNIVLSAVEGEDLDMKLVNPVAAA